MRHASELTSEQRHALRSRLQPTAGYLIRLARRMQQLGWDPECDVYKAAWQAHERPVAPRMAITYSDTKSAGGPGRAR